MRNNAFKGMAVGLSCLAALSSSSESHAQSDAPKMINAIKYESALPAIGALRRGGYVHCTATALEPRIVLTALHCVKDFKPGEELFFEVNVGGEKYQTRVRDVLKRFPVQLGRKIHDGVALLLLASPLPEAIDFREIQLPQTPPNPPPTKLHFVGYGYDEYGRVGQKQAVSMDVKLDDNKILHTDPHKNTCHGDSGAPALNWTYKKTYDIIGVVSYGDKDCAVYGVAVRVDKLSGAITKALANQSAP